MTVHETTDGAAGQGGAAPRSARALARARRLHALARFWRQYRSHRGGVFGLAVLVVIALLALAAPLLAGEESGASPTPPARRWRSRAVSSCSAPTSSAGTCWRCCCGGPGSP